MIKSITFIDPNGFDLPKDIYCDYMYTLPSLRGKTFEFTPKINVIVGKNGSGKTSLLKVLRYLTFCDGINLYIIPAAALNNFPLLFGRRCVLNNA